MSVLGVPLENGEFEVGDVGEVPNGEAFGGGTPIAVPVEESTDGSQINSNCR